MNQSDFIGKRFLVKKDGRRWEIDHVSKNYVFLKTLFSSKDYNGNQQNKIDSRGFCRITISSVETLLGYDNRLYWLE